jgi:hypothetical protein
LEDTYGVGMHCIGSDEEDSQAGDTMLSLGTTWEVSIAKYTVYKLMNEQAIGPFSRYDILWLDD